MSANPIPRPLIAASALAAYAATGVSLLTMWRHLKNYRRPDAQRLICRILWMVPIYALSSHIALTIDPPIPMYIDALRDLYEAFVLYSFFGLCVALMGGEREMLRRLEKRPWVDVGGCGGRLNMSDPSTFLLIRRIIFQFVILKPVLTGIVFILQLTGAYTEGLIAWGSLYFWVSMVYNVSVSLALWGLVVLLLAVKEELVEYRPVSKFLCVKAIVFFSWWQSLFIALLVWIGIIRGTKDYPPQSLATALQDLLMTFECLGLSIWHITVFPPGDYDPNSNPSAPKLSGRLPLLYAFRDAIGFRDIIDDWNHTVLLGTRFEGRRLNDEERWERALEDAGEGGRLRRSIERVRSDDPGAEGRWVLANSQRYYDSAVVRTATAPGDPESGLEEVLHASVEFPDPAAPNEQEVERLYGQARALLYGDYNYPVLGGPGAPTAEALRRKAAGYLYQVEGDDHAYLAGYHDGSNEGLPGGGSEDRGRSPGTIGAVRETSSRSRSREPAVVEPEEEEEEEDYAGRGNVPLLGSKGKGKVKLAIPRSSLEGKPDKSPILSPIDPEEVKDAMLLDMDDDGGGDEEEHGGR